MSKSTTAVQLGFALLGTIPPTASPFHLTPLHLDRAVFPAKGKNQSHVYPCGNVTRFRAYRNDPSRSTLPTEEKERKRVRARERERERRRSERAVLSVCQAGSHSLHNCSELNSSLVAPPEITLLLLLSPPHLTSLFPARTSLFQSLLRTCRGARGSQRPHHLR